MGGLGNSKHQPSEQYEILKKAGKLTGLLDKPFGKYKAVDEHELSIAFADHLLMPPAPENESVPEIDIDEPPESQHDTAPTMAVAKVSFSSEKSTLEKKAPIVRRSKNK